MCPQNQDTIFVLNSRRESKGNLLYLLLLLVYATTGKYKKRRRKRQSNGSINDDTSSEKYSKQEEASSESASKIPIDFKHMLSLEANSDMMSYIQEKSQYYTETLDKRCVFKR